MKHFLPWLVLAGAFGLLGLPAAHADPQDRVLIYYGNSGWPPGWFGQLASYNTLKARYESAGLAADYTDQLPSDLTGYRLVYLVAPGGRDDSPANFFSPVQVQAFRDCLLAGGRLVVLGDNSGVNGTTPSTGFSPTWAFPSDSWRTSTSTASTSPW